MKLSSLLKGVQTRQIVGDSDPEIQEIEFDSRRVQSGSLFVAVSGTQVDGHTFIDKSIEQGAAAVVCEQLPEQLSDQVVYVVVEKSQAALGQLCANFYGNPVQDLVLVGITGTNGKSTTVTLLHQLFNMLGLRSGLISTIRYMVGNEEFPSSHTTPDPKQLHRLFAEMKEAGCEYCFMEVSSHSLIQDRVEGIPFKVGAFTNITHDHLDYHGTFKAYIAAKKLLFDGLGPDSVAIINVDDKHGQVMVQNTQATVKTFAQKRMADYRVRMLENSFEGLLLEIDGMETWFKLLGSFNAYNLVMVYAIARELGLERDEVLRTLSNLEGVDGRFQVLRSSGNKLGIVDYAHTPDALQNVLGTIQDINKGSQQVITVVGCGGNRDKAKRPKMAQIATNLSDKVVLTSDNPRNEPPAQILDDMMAGVPEGSKRKVLRIEDRTEGIRTACLLANPGDIILVAGKGHEDYQEIQGKKIPFDDRKILLEQLNL
ncbi:UDP-N-acetylmuramoyl-L-alanyl-D-glutamate--2,6-diaminopimelate ligase [Pontibacter sp. G13]|uniref:UDP-N-acetylmuramoyl-L-alanyl-D-glutamate--2, 6-diaminopimelate ligase n=1 Tax=Pontibacter sp. G13 TaxID=3074898 RepID=UPI00288C4D2D|nr:UDP-N-acetylmuramoyl-L-alanyl-D-glutamate--2,6-diaminopimelate ligase [Pontibacter sp. G13]WNJ20258.1 UDP-N-acetylmuramoyl-L-alanyl-D-glutamate--2,6-diaminopimelate ligase [Pontibacter sp. G13]